MIKNIIFDFDGVLVDSEILAAKAFSQYLSSNGFEFSEIEFENFAGKKTIEVIDILSNRFNFQDKEKFYNDVMKLTYNIYKNELTPVYGILEYLKKCDKNLFIGSNSVKQRIIDGLKKVSLNKYFNESKIYSFDMVEKPKPFPDIYLKVIKENLLNKKESIIIEDSVVGVKAGVAAEIKVIGLIAGGHWHAGRSKNELLNAGAYKVINNYAELDEAIKI